MTVDRCSNCDANLPGMSDRSDSFVEGTYLRNGRYLIEKLLASGKLGRIYQGEDTNADGAAIALREFTPAIVQPAILERIVQWLTSAIIQQQQFEHSQVAKFWQVFAEDDRIFLVGDLVQGKSYKYLLQQKKRRGECFTEAEVIHLWRQLLPVLSELHGQGVIHRYIAPENILYLGGDRLPVLIDCGGIQELAIKLISPSNFSSNIPGNWGKILRGKLGYAPEEQVRSGMVSPSSDLYALAVTSVVLMTGKPPEKLIDVFTMSWNWQTELNLTPFLKTCLIKMLAPQPGDRFQSASELLDLIESNPELPLPIIEAEARIQETPEIVDEPAQNPSEQFPEFENLVVTKTSDSSFEVQPDIPSSLIDSKELKRWNWGAAILPGLWCLSNNVWWGLLAWVGFFINLATGIFLWFSVGFILGIAGNSLAWKSRKWKSIAEFKTHQKAWGIFLGVIGVISLISFLLMIVVIFSVF